MSLVIANMFLVLSLALGDLFLVVFIPSFTVGFENLGVLCMPSFLLSEDSLLVLCIMFFMVGTPTNSLLVIAMSSCEACYK